MLRNIIVKILGKMGPEIRALPNMEISFPVEASLFERELISLGGQSHGISTRLRRSITRLLKV